MDPPPTELYSRNQHAYLLMLQLHEHPRLSITTAEARRIISGSTDDARRALTDLTELGALERTRPGHYRDPHLVPAPQPVLRTCRRCNQPITPPLGRKVFCSSDCRVRWHHANWAMNHPPEPKPTSSTCVICGTTMPLKPRGGHQLYCSRHCEHIAERRRRVERALEAGTAGVCETCGQPTVSTASRWCSMECQAKFARSRRT